MHLFPGTSIDIAAVTTDKVRLPVADAHDISLSVLRLDKIHPVISGNKWFKLNYHLWEAQQRKATGLLTFGGAYSNHIIAVACAAAELGWPCTGIIRGEKPALLSPTLQEAEAYGMQLVFMDRGTYKASSDGLAAAASEKYPGYYVIPEGGSGPLGIQGSREIPDLADKASYSHLLCAIGTATMFTGLAQSALPGQQVIGIPILKGEATWQVPPGARIIPGYHFGGYARKTPALLDFINFFYDHTGIPTDFVYTGKLLYAVVDMIEKSYFPPNSRLLVVHSGGLQGNRSLPAGALHF